MNEVTRILSAIEQGDPLAAEKLLPLIYDELRRLAAQRMAQVAPGANELLVLRVKFTDECLELPLGIGTRGSSGPGCFHRVFSSARVEHAVCAA